VADSFVLPVDADLLALQPHAHYLAHDVKGTATFPDGSSRTLISIPDWDLRWQHGLPIRNARDAPERHHRFDAVRL
jgi:hypothetical protein